MTYSAKVSFVKPYRAIILFCNFINGVLYWGCSAKLDEFTMQRLQIKKCILIAWLELSHERRMQNH